MSTVKPPRARKPVTLPASHALGKAGKSSISPVWLPPDVGVVVRHPAMLQGEESGFEWYLCSVARAEELPEYPFKEHFGDAELKADLCFTSYADEDVTSAIAGAVLAKLTGGYYWDPGIENRFLQGDDAIDAAWRMVEDWKRRGPFDRTAEATNAPPVIQAKQPSATGQTLSGAASTTPIRPDNLWRIGLDFLRWFRRRILGKSD